ncbi:uncharacterized protein LOC143292194 [Babylonia areolata]|uniref:uncharacterized protein LOC143292194 n=1 Tax=Babylonia areolata TaxID=304850 RepID=UPI003FD0BCA0
MGRNGMVKTFTGESVKVKQPCTFTLADMTCGEYDVLVMSRYTLRTEYSVPRYLPLYLMVLVAGNHQVWRGISWLDDLKRYVADPSHSQPTPQGQSTTTLWHTLWEHNHGATFAWFDPVSRAAVVSDAADTFRVELRSDHRAHSVVCRDLRRSEPYPVSLCQSPQAPRRNLNSRKKALGLQKKRQLVILAILRKEIVIEIDEQSRDCLSLKHAFSGCANQTLAIRTCEPFLSSRALLALYGTDYHRFQLCLETFCKRSAYSCRELRSNLAVQASLLPDRVRQRLVTDLDCDAF